METNELVKKKVLIAVPCYYEIHCTVVATLCQILLNNKEYQLDTIISHMRGIGEHKNRMAEEFLKTDCDYLLMMDSDNPPPPNVLDLVKLDKDVITCPTPINMSVHRGLNDLYWNIFGDDGFPIKEEGRGLQQVSKVGSGCILIRRNVLEKIPNPFTTVRGENDIRVVGADIAFSNKCTSYGFELYAHWDFKCRHYKQVDLLSMI